MEPGPSPDRSGAAPLCDVDRAALLAIARESIAHGLDCGGLLGVDAAAHSPALRAPGASFVTLRRGAALRGCTGSLEAVRPLVADVARNAHRSAFDDPRFPPLGAHELSGLHVHLSRLGPRQPLRFASEDELLAQLRPGVDGLVLRQGEAQATFLPSVWQSLPDPRAFVAELRLKAGLPATGALAALEAERYEVEEIE